MATLDDILQLQQPLKDGGIRNVNFFNGRLLTSKDLTREQEARRQSEARIGALLGEGVARGLEVTRDPTPGLPAGATVRIAAGLVVNRLGQTLCLADDTSVVVTRQFDAGSTSACLFGACDKLVGGTYVAGAGLYVLTIAPSSVSEGKAPTNGLDPGNVRCSTDITIDALQFRLLALTPQMQTGLDFASPALRNVAAYACFGAGVQASWFSTLMNDTARGDDLLDQLRAIRLGDAEVPLALLYFTGASTLEFIDLWAVRRPLHQRETETLGGLVEGRRLAVGQAMYRQFQAQVADLAQPLVLPDAVTAQAAFRYLPPVGVIPVAEETDATDARATHFFEGMTYRGPAFINAARVESLVREGLAYPPIDTQSGEFVWLYRVQENRRAIDNATTPARPRSYIVFSSGHMPYRADAQLDVARWNYSNFALMR